MIMTKLPAAAVLSAAALAACSSGPPTVDEIGDEIGCESIWKEQTDEMFVRSEYDCVHGDLVNVDGVSGQNAYRHTTLYIFDDNQARDSWRELVELVGTVVLHEGDRWIEVR